MPQANPQNPRQLVKVMQIITGAILTGPVIFLAIVLLTSGDQPPQDPSLAYIAAAFAAVMIFTHFLIRLRPNPSALPESKRGGNFDPFSDEVFAAIAPTYQTELIIKIALLEGAAFFNIIAYQWERQWWSLAISALLLALIAIQFPTVSRIQERIKNQTRYWFDESA